MTWALYYLATHEDMQDKLYAEVNKYYKGGPITWDMIKNITYVASFCLQCLLTTRHLHLMWLVLSDSSCFPSSKITFYEKQLCWSTEDQHNCC